MASREMVAICCAVIALAATPVTFSAPAQRQTCSSTCIPGRSTLVKYEEGKSYIYNFETEVITSVVGTSDETNKIKVKGQAFVAAQSACDLVLTVQQIAITSSSGQAVSHVNDIEGSSIRFSYADGVIENVCVSDDDPTWSANIKRAIVSMLGNRGLNGDSEAIEADINGKCKTTYEVDGNRYTKTKDVHSCTNRDGGMSNTFGIPYSSPSKYHSIPIFDSVLVCTQELGKGVIQSVECNEGHALNVLETSGVRTDIKSSLQLANVQAGIVKGTKEPNKKSCLLFDFKDHSQSEKAAATNAADLLNKICTEIESGSVSLKVPGLFLQLRKQVRNARKEDLKALDDQIVSGKLCPKQSKQLRKLLLDGAAMSAGDGAIGYVADVIANGQAEETTKDLFIAYAAFAEHPGPQALEGVTTLISKPTTEPEFLLAASGLGHQYCRLVNANCGSNEQYQNLVNTIAHRVSVATEEEAIEKVVVALQALGNVDNLTPQAVTAIVTLLEDSHTNQRLKVRALDAFRRDPCQETLKKKAAKIFTDIQEASHVRIQAYLTFSRCLTRDDVPVVQAVIDNDEESNQVGSFLVSHISNVLESSNPDKEAQKAVFEAVTLREFPSDVRKFSRNIEFSVFNPSLMNSGLSLDSNLIFSQDSYIPRCSNSNFTVAAFGRSYNLLELGICAEDFEHIVERLLGPSSKIRTTSLDDIIREGAQKINSLKNSISNRFKRDVAETVNENEIDAIRNEVAISERTGDDANGDIYVRVLGTSILVESFSRSGLKRNPLIARIQRAAENLAKGVREQNIDLTEPFMFLDDEVIAPTSSGLPLTTTTEGTSVLSLHIKGNMDVAALLRGENGDMKATITPSTATVIRAKMLLGSGPVESGLSLEGKLHSSAGLDLKVLRENRKVELSANLPQERIQLLDVRSDIYWVEQSMDHLEKKTPVKTNVALRSIVNNACTMALADELGLKICADVKAPSGPMSSLFISGPSVLSVSIEKTEASMQGYYVMIESLNNDNTYGFDLVLDTPGSKTNRKISAQGRAVSPVSATPQYSLKLETPKRNVQLNYKRSFTDDLVGAEVNVDVDGEAFSGIAEVRRTAEGSGFRLAPLVQYQLPNGNPVKLLEGTITREPGKKLNIDIRTGGPIRALRGNIKGTGVVTQNTENTMVIELQNLELASDALGKLELDGTYKREGKLYDMKLNSKYGQGSEHTLSLETKVGSPADGEKVLKVTSRSSRRAFLNLDLDWSLKRTGHSIEHNLQYTRGLTEPKVSINQKSVLKIVSKKDFDVHNLLTVAHPSYNIDFHGEAQAKSAPGADRNAKLEARLGTSLQAKATYEGNGPLFSNYKVLANAVVGETTYEVSEVATKVDENNRNFKSRLSVQPGFYYEANTDLLIKMQKDDFKTEVNTQITSDQLEQPIIFKSAVAAKADGYGAVLKLDAQGKTYVDLQTTHQVNRANGQPKAYTTKLKAHILDIIDAKLANTYSNGNGDLVLDALLPKSGRKIAGTSKVQRNGETYNLNADLKWDADRDSSKAITLKSVTTLAYSELRLDTQNEITLIGDTVKVNLKGGLARDIFNGESTAAIDYVSPAGKTYSASTKVDLERKSSVRAGKVLLHVAPADVNPSEIEIGVRASNLNPQERTYDIKADLKANYRQSKDLTLHGELSNSLPGNYRSYAGKVSASGSAIPKPVDASFKADVKSGRIALKGETVNPSKSSIDATVDYDTWSPKKTLGVKYSITTPVERVKTLEGEISGGVLRNSWKNFEVTNKVSITLNGGAPYSSTFSVSALNNEGQYSHSLVSQGSPLVSITAKGKRDERSLQADLKSEVRGSVSKLNLNVEHELPDLAITLSGQSALVDGGKSFEFKVNNKKQSDGTLDTLVTVRTDDDDKFRVSNKLEYTPTRKSIDAQLVIADETPQKLYVLFNEEQAGKYNVEVTCKWGDNDKYLTTKGSLFRHDEAFEGELSLDSPALRANKFSVKVAKSLTDGKHGVDITIDGNNKRQIAIAATYAAKATSGHERSYEGTLKVEGQVVEKPIDFNGNFRLDDTQLDKQRDNGEEGRRVKASVELTSAENPLKLNLLAKRSNKENRLQLTMCKDSGCQVGNIRFKHDHHQNGLDYELRVTAETTVGDATEQTNGIVIASRVDNAAEKFEHSGKLIIGTEKDNQIGYRLYRISEKKEMGAEILLPARVIALVATGDKQGAGGYKGEIAFFIDKTKKADRKISLLLDIGAKSSGANGAQSRSLAAIFRHPDLTKDMKVETKYSYGSDSVVFEVETIIDVLQAGHELVAGYSLQKQVVPEGRSYLSALSIVSNGLNINFASKSDLKYINRELSYENFMTYTNRDKQVLTSSMTLGVNKERFSFVVKSPSETYLSFVSAYISHPNGGEIKYEVHLPGMEDTRIVRAIANTVSPRNVQLKFTTSKNTNEQYVEAFLGFRSNDELAAGIYDHQTDGRHVLGDVTLGMNGTRILSVSSEWKKENARTVLNRVQERGQKQLENLKSLASKAVEEVAEETKRISSNIRAATPDLSAVSTASRQQLQELKQELEQNEDTKMILQRIKTSAVMVRQVSRVVAELVRSARRIALAYVGGLREALKNLPEKYSQLLERIPEYVEQLKALATDGVEALVSASKVASKVLLEAAERFYESLPPLADMWNWVVSHSEGIIQSLSELAQVVADKLAKVYSVLQELGNKVLTNKALQNLLRELRDKAQGLIEEFIADTKESLEAFKEYVLSAVPQKEFQELVQAIADYIQKKAQKTAVDDEAALKNIYEKLRATVSKAFADVFTYDLSQGIFRAQIPLPFSLKSLSQFTKVLVLPSRPKINFRVPSYAYGLRELINQIRSGAAINELVPPFKGWALLIGSKHYKTFDGRFFDFEGNCQYLLASDFEDGNFTVVADYERVGDVSTKSIIVTDRVNQVAIKPDSSVVVNGQVVNLDEPKQAGTLLIERIGNWIAVRSQKGAVLGCSTSADVCAVKVDGFYHGKVLGLLGTMNLEKYDDLRKPNGEITPSVDQFVASWKLDKQCTEPMVITTMIHATQSAEEKCRAALDSKSSSLRPCYGVVDPTPYRNVCEKLSQKPGFSEEKAVCTAATGYAKACYLSYAKVDTSSACAAA